MQRLYAVLKIILAFLCMLAALIFTLSGISVITTGYFTELAGIPELIAGLFAFVVLFGSVFLLGRWGYRLFMRVRQSKVLARKKPLSPLNRKLLAVLCIVTGFILIVLDTVSVLTRPRLDDNINAAYNQGSILGYWAGVVLLLAAGIYLMVIGGRLLKPEREKIELLGEEF